jgi:adenylylsulfate kinase
MTGISAPYEEPENADLIVETDRLPLDESVEWVIRFLNTARIIFLRS